MRYLFSPQMSLTSTSEEDLIGHLAVCDDIDKLAIAYHAIWHQRSLRDAITEKIASALPSSSDLGRIGMDCWKLFVFGSLRVCLDIDYARLQNLANNHRGLRLLIGHGDLDYHQRYSLTTMKENIPLIPESVIDEINVLIVKHGQQSVHPYSRNNALKCRADSYVAKTNVHFPTDISLLYDALRKLLCLLGEFSKTHGINGYRQYKANRKKLKKAMHRAARSRKCNEKAKQAAHQSYVVLAQHLLNEAAAQYEKICAADVVFGEELQMSQYRQYADTLIDQIDRRVLKGEVIAHHEKLFSIFEPHTEWVAKGKAGVPVELGVKLAVVQDQHQFILHHHVMEHQQDVDVAIDLVRTTKVKYDSVQSFSFDRGYWSPSNYETLDKEVDRLVLPKKGYKNEARDVIENEKTFKKLRHQHSAVESGIHALGHHGLNTVPDKGIENYKRYIAFGILGYNLHRLGSILLESHERLRRKRAA